MKSDYWTTRTCKLHGKGIEIEKIEYRGQAGEDQPKAGRRKMASRVTLQHLSMGTTTTRSRPRFEMSGIAFQTPSSFLGGSQPLG